MSTVGALLVLTSMCVLVIVALGGILRASLSKLRDHLARKREQREAWKQDAHASLNLTVEKAEESQARTETLQIRQDEPPPQ